MNRNMFNIRIKMIKILLVLSASLFITLPITWIVTQTNWWMTYVVTFIIAVLIHNPISLWVENNKDKIPK